MDTKATIPNEADVIAANEKLTADLAAANSLTATEANRANAAEARATTAEASLATANTNLVAVTAERDTLKAANVKLEADMKDFNARVAADVAKAGIRKEAIATNA